jgi:carboxymethylenebutenolidase
MSVSEEHLDLPLSSGRADAILVTPEGEGPWPGVLHLSDIWGIRPDREAMARRQAAWGYAVLLPNIFWRVGKAPVFDFEPKLGEERTMKRLGELRANLTPAQMSEDAAFYLDWLSSRPDVKAGPLGVVGYCFTGAMAVRAAAARPGKVAIAASFHGGGLVTDDAASPHRLLPQIRSRLYFAHGIEDRSMTAEGIETLEATLKEWGGRYGNEVYDGAYHGWTIPGHAYNEAQAERHYDTLKSLFAEELG